MRVELIYAPGCNTYRKALHVLETVIAEERLPIPVELSERASHALEPVIKIDNEVLESHAHSESECGQKAVGKLPCIEQVRNILSNKWRELTLSSMPAF
jgi:hypothetical protein